MGEINQKSELQRFVPGCDGRILKIGAKDHGNTAGSRNQFAVNEHVADLPSLMINMLDEQR